MGDHSFYEPFAEFCKRDNYDDVFRDALENVAANVDFSLVKSCVAFGPGGGEQEMKFIRRLMPNLRSFIAVEEDEESVKALRASFEKGMLPGVETSVVDATVQSWGGDNNQVDAALLFSVLCHINTPDRKDLFRQLAKHVSPGGLVAINENHAVPNGYVALLNRLGATRVDYDEVEKDMEEAGFRVLFKQDFTLQRDLSNPNAGVVQYIQICSFFKFSDAEVRAAIEDIYRQPEMRISRKKLAIFTK